MVKQNNIKIASRKKIFNHRIESSLDFIKMSLEVIKAYYSMMSKRLPYKENFDYSLDFDKDNSILNVGIEYNDVICSLTFQLKPEKDIDSEPINNLQELKKQSKEILENVNNRTISEIKSKPEPKKEFSR